MSDFTSEFWSFYVAALTLIGIAACAVLLWSQSTQRVKIEEGKPADGTTGHVWDEDLTELNNPLPRWWMWMFYLTIVFGVAYLLLYPGLGTFAGKLGWKSTGEYQAELAKADAEYGPLFNGYLGQDLKAVAADPQARAIGERLFLTYCAQCHGSDARGSKGFPNLTDRDWLYGGTPEVIKTTILEGRHGVMPPMEAALGRRAGHGECGALRAEPVRLHSRPDQGRIRQAEIRRLRRLPRRRRQGQPGAGRAESDRQDLAVWRQRRRPSWKPSAKGATTRCRRSRISLAKPRCMCWRPMSGACRTRPGKRRNNAARLSANSATDPCILSGLAGVCWKYNHSMPDICCLFMEYMIGQDAFQSPLMTGLQRQEYRRQ